MSRIIKFRGKRIDNGEWVYGEQYTPRLFDSKRGYSGEYAPCIFCDEGGVPVIPESIGQFTGLHDKNGKEIYEGDIFTVNGKYPKLIEYRQEYAGFCMANTYDLEDRPYIEPWQRIHLDWWTDYKRGIMLIGNIHDNPELLNEK